MTPRSTLLLLLFVLTIQKSFSQNLPIIRANSDQVSIRDGNTFNKNAWTFIAAYPTDIYTSNQKNKTVTLADKG